MEFWKEFDKVTRKLSREYEDLETLENQSSYFAELRTIERIERELESEAVEVQYVY